MGTAIKHPVPDRVKLSFVIFDIRALWRSRWASECPDVKNYKWRLNPVWHRMLYSCTNMATVGVKGLTCVMPRWYSRYRWTDEDVIISTCCLHYLLFRRQRLRLVTTCRWFLLFLPVSTRLCSPQVTLHLCRSTLQHPPHFSKKKKKIFIWIKYMNNIQNISNNNKARLPENHKVNKAGHLK